MLPIVGCHSLKAIVEWQSVGKSGSRAKETKIAVATCVYWAKTMMRMTENVLKDMPVEEVVLPGVLRLLLRRPGVILLLLHRLGEPL